MMYDEFKARVSEDISYEIFEKYEKMYMAGHLDKDDFCRMVKRHAIAEQKSEPYKNGMAAKLKEFIDKKSEISVELSGDELSDIMVQMVYIADAYRRNKEEYDRIMSKA